MSKSVKLILKILTSSLLIVGVAFVVWFFSGEGERAANIEWGVTFAPTQAEFLGLDARQVFTALLDDMQVRNFRLMAPWNQGEKKMGEYDFSSVDWMVKEADARGANVVLAVGRKLFRWPECHDPE